MKQDSLILYLYHFSDDYHLKSSDAEKENEVPQKGF